MAGEGTLAGGGIPRCPPLCMKPRKLSIVASKVSEAGHRKGNGGREDGEGMELMLLLMHGHVCMCIYM